MKFSGVLAAAASLVGVSQAQSTSAKASMGSMSAMTTRPASMDPNMACLTQAVQIPGCGLSVLTAIGSKSFNCALTDLECQCVNSAAIQAAGYNSVLSACGPTTALQVQSSADVLCQCVKYTGVANIPASLAVTRSTPGVNPFANQLCVSYGLAIPTCGTAVLQSLGASIGKCGAFDFACQCDFQSQVQAVASTPIINACGTSQALHVQGSAAQLCSCITANNQGISGASGSGSAAAATATAAPSKALAAGQPELVYGGRLVSIFAGFMALML